MELKKLDFSLVPVLTGREEGGHQVASGSSLVQSCLGLAGVAPLNL